MEFAEILAENAETLFYSSIGFGVGATSTYTKKYYHQKGGREPFPSSDPGASLRQDILEDDPMYSEHEENALMELYYDNFDVVKNNYDEAKTAGLITLILDSVDVFMTEGNALGIEQYPETGAGIFAGIKVGRKVPTPVDVADYYRKLTSGRDKTGSATEF